MRMKAAVILLLAVALHGAAAATQPAASYVKKDLNSAGWDIFNQNETTAVGPVTLPVMVLQALYEADMLDQGDPLAGCVIGPGLSVSFNLCREYAFSARPAFHRRLFD